MESQPFTAILLFWGATFPFRASCERCSMGQAPMPSMSAAELPGLQEPSQLHLLGQQRRHPLARSHPKCCHLAFQPRAHPCRTAGSSVPPGTQPRTGSPARPCPARGVRGRQWQLSAGSWSLAASRPWFRAGKRGQGMKGRALRFFLF